MAFVSLKETLPTRKNFFPILNDPAVRVATYTDKRQRKSTVFAFNKALMKKNRWLIGDKVDVLVDESHGEIIIKRVASDADGWTISGAPKGRTVGGHIRISTRAGVPVMVNPDKGAALGLQLNGDSIRFRLPEGWDIEGSSPI